MTGLLLLNRLHLTIPQLFDALVRFLLADELRQQQQALVECVCYRAFRPRCLQGTGLEASAVRHSPHNLKDDKCFMSDHVSCSGKNTSERHTMLPSTSRFWNSSVFSFCMSLSVSSNSSVPKLLCAKCKIPEV